MVRPIAEIQEGELFAGSWAKVSRAYDFIVELESELDRYLKDSPVKVVGFVPEENAIDIEVKGSTLLPGVILGDVVHNLRASLDLMACELARKNDRRDKDVYFPTGPDEAGFKAAIKGRNFNRAGTDAVSEVELIAPYLDGGAGRLIRIMHDLDIEDKHKALVVLGSKTTIEFRGQYEVNNPAGGTFEADVSGMRYEFPAGHLLQGEDVIDSAKHFLNATRAIILRFERLVQRRAIEGRSAPF
jgi:hypothetical protein